MGEATPAKTQTAVPVTNLPILAPVDTPPVEEMALPPDPTRLTGLNPAEIQALLGAPTLVRRDANVQMMLFENGNCVFEVVFLEPTPSEHFKAAATNARTTNGTDMNQSKCLADLLPMGQWLDTGK